MVSSAARTTAVILIAVIGVAGLVLFFPLSSPSDELPVVDAGTDEPHKVTGERDVNQSIAVQYYFGGRRQLVIDELVYDADSQRGFNTFGGDETADESAELVYNESVTFYVEPLPKNDSRTRVYSRYLDINQDKEERETYRTEVYDDANNDVAYNADNTTQYTYEVYNGSAIEAIREETLAEYRRQSLAYTNGRIEYESPITDNYSPTLVAPNYSKTGTRTLNGQTYDVYEPRPHWVGSANDPRMSAYNVSGEVLYGDSPPHYRRIDVSYDYVRGNTRFALLRHSITEPQRVGIDLEQTRIVGNNTVSSADVPCPSWTSRVGPEPTCRNETA